MYIYYIDNPSGIAKMQRKKVFGKCFWIYRNMKCFSTPGTSQNLSTKTCFFSQSQTKNFYENLHRQSETKIAKTSLPGRKPTYDQTKKNQKKIW